YNIRKSSYHSKQKALLSKIETRTGTARKMLVPSKGIARKCSPHQKIVFDTTSINCEVISMVVGVFYRYGNTLRFQGAAGEPPCATALRGLAEAFPPPGVSVYFLRWYCIYYH